MDNVYTLQKPEMKIWQCYCGCQQFFLYQNGDIGCCGCNEISQTMKCFSTEDDYASDD